MKNILIIFFLHIYWVTYSQNQVNLISSCGLANGNFDQYCGAYHDPNSCPLSFYLQNTPGSPPCVPNWTRSHGSPQIFVSPNPIDNIAYMWGVLGHGEGIFAGYSFAAHTAYRVELKLQASDNVGTYNVFAASGMTDPNPSSDCDGTGPIPNVTNKLLIVRTTEPIPNTWQVRPYSFITGSTAYSQLWIYPESPNGTQLNFYLDYVSVCLDCSGVIIYNSGQVPTGLTSAGYINAGSSAGTGGSGTVTVSATATTQFRAAKEINLLPSFEAVVTSSGTFSADFFTCFEGTRSTSNDYANRNIDINRFPKPNDNEIWNAQDKIGQLNVYPTVTSGIVNIRSSIPGEKVATLLVVDQLGRQVSTARINLQNSLQTIDLGKLTNGVYFIQVKNNQKNLSTKVILNK